MKFGGEATATTVDLCCLRQGEGGGRGELSGDTLDLANGNRTKVKPLNSGSNEDQKAPEDAKRTQGLSRGLALGRSRAVRSVLADLLI